MKAIKYLVILLCIVFIGGAIYFSLQDGAINEEQEVTVDAPIPLVYEVLTDFSKWDEWNKHITIEDSSNQLLLNDVDATAKYKYGSAEFGTLTLKSLDSLDSVKFDFISKGGTSLSLNILLDSIEKNQTKIKTIVTGDRDLTDKIVARFLSDEITDEMIPALQDPFIDSLDASLKSMMATYTISEPFKTATSGGFHLMMTQSTNVGFVPELRNKIEAGIINFMRRHNIAASGPTKLIYDQVDQQNGTAIITVAIPIQEKIITEVNSSIICQYKNPVEAIRCTLNGDTQNLELVRTKIDKFIEQQGLSRSSYAPWEVYRVDAEDVYNPANQITEVYIPVE
ncbi:hypothetical protein BST97_01815 [Nonlabens spongiae]|uniref:Bacterial transcription activator effector binding domain-containing protein n=1 Tax=Nonlabens spongiae TaxID=331648 RepID=A0A1W6MGU4_9FLAO|nr:hypothetical protein [Nonlabens spongiae]ARN76834.1 hypothetical protein BST97_01815 [Nonlabens spongiae]